MGLFYNAKIINVPVEELKEAAARIQGFADDNADIFDQVYNSLQVLENNGEWKGISASAAANATRENKEKFSEAVEELAELAAFLKNFAEEIDTTDETLKMKINMV